MPRTFSHPIRIGAKLQLTSPPAALSDEEMESSSGDEIPFKEEVPVEEAANGDEEEAVEGAGEDGEESEEEYGA